MKTLQAPDENFIAWMRDIRRALHRNPELGFQEYETARLIGDRLTQLGISFKSGVAETGIVATLGDGPAGCPCVALRADMDALAVEEKTGLPFASEKPGVMHACGHDGHVAMLLGAAAMLQKCSLPGRVVLLFQPAEEGEGGARRMIEEGALAGVQSVFAGHIDRHLEVGQIGVEPGLITAYTDGFRIVIRGRGGHAAKPHETVDSIVVASLLVMSIQTLVSREINPSYPTVVTVGQIKGGTAPNVIAEEAVLEGTIRSTHPEVRNSIISGLKRMVKGMEELYQAETMVEIKSGYPPVVNHPVATEIASQAVRETVGRDGLIGLPHPSLGGEDFSFFLEQAPGCLVRFGAMRQDLTNAPAHSPYFDFDEDVLPVGAAFLARAAMLALERFEDIRR